MTESKKGTNLMVNLWSMPLRMWATTFAKQENVSAVLDWGVSIHAEFPGTFTFIASKSFKGVEKVQCADS